MPVGGNTLSVSQGNKAAGNDELEADYSLCSRSSVEKSLWKNIGIVWHCLEETAL